MGVAGIRRGAVAAYRWGEGVARRRIAPTSAWRTHERYSDARGSRLAASITYYGFLSLFPLIAVAATVVAATLGKDQIDRIETELRENLPGIADQVPIGAMVNHAGTIGLISAVVLLYSGLSWVGVTRASVRTIWGVHDDPGNFFVRKLADLGSLLGLGLAMALSAAATTLATGVAQQVLHWLGLRDTLGAGVLLAGLGIAFGIALGMVLFGYLLSGIARIRLPRRRLLLGSFVGAIGFEVLKLGIGSYLEHVATKNVYGAFGTPIALLIWINLVSRLLLYCAAWTAVKAERPGADVVPFPERDRQDEHDDEDRDDEDRGDRDDRGGGGRRGSDGDTPREDGRDRPPRIPAAGPRSATKPCSWPAAKPRHPARPPRSTGGRAAAQPDGDHRRSAPRRRPRPV